MSVRCERGDVGCSVLGIQMQQFSAARRTLDARRAWAVVDECQCMCEHLVYAQILPLVCLVAMKLILPVMVLPKAQPLVYSSGFVQMPFLYLMTITFFIGTLLSLIPTFWYALLSFCHCGNANGVIESGMTFEALSCSPPIHAVMKFYFRPVCVYSICSEFFCESNMDAKHENFLA